MKIDLEDDLFESINGNAKLLEERIQSLVAEKRSLKYQHNNEVESLEAKIFSFLWRCRPYMTTAKIARMVGLSRQGLYSKWSKYGYTPDDQD
jgi:DNA-binding NtrC family response regulator